MSMVVGAGTRHFLDVVRILVRRDFNGNYRSTSLGLLWTLASPLLHLGVFYLVFGVVLKMGVPHYAGFVMIGVLSWGWLQASLGQAVTSITSNPNFVSQPGFPAVALPVVPVVSTCMTFLIALPLLVAMLLFDGVELGAAVLLLPLVMLTQAVLTLALAYMVAALNVRFRDMQYIIPVLLQLGYYVTPIFYSPDRVNPELRRWLELNPMASVIGAYRSIFLGSSPANWAGLSTVFLISTAILWMTFSYFQRSSERFLEEI